MPFNCRKYPNKTVGEIFIEKISKVSTIYDMKTKISRWGNSLALRLPQKLAASHNLEEGSAVELIEDSGELKLRPLKEVNSGLEELLARITEENRHTEVKTGSAVGKESW